MRMRGPHSTFARVFHVILAGHVLVDEEFAYDLGQVGQHSIPVLNGYILNWYIYVYIYRYVCICIYMYIHIFVLEAWILEPYFSEPEIQMHDLTSWGTIMMTRGRNILTCKWPWNPENSDWYSHRKNASLLTGAQPEETNRLCSVAWVCGVAHQGTSPREGRRREAEEEPCLPREAW